MAKLISLLIVQLCAGLVVCMDTYYMTNYCNAEVDMIMDGIDTGRLSLDGSYVGDCNATIETWYTADRLMFHFEDFNIPKPGVYCDESYIEIYDGQPPYMTPFHGLSRRLCGGNTPGGSFVPSGRYVTFRYVNKNPLVTANMNLIFTAFHNGYCFSYEYKCSNGRCIDDSINCNGFNPCGDDSDCALSTAAIVGIVVGATFGACVILTIVFVVCRQRRVRQPTVFPAQATSPFEVTPAALLHSVPPPSYGVSNVYSTPQTYGVPTTIQGNPTTFK